MPWLLSPPNEKFKVKLETAQQVPEPQISERISWGTMNYVYPGVPAYSVTFSWTSYYPSLLETLQWAGRTRGLAWHIILYVLDRFKKKTKWKSSLLLVSVLGWEGRGRCSTAYRWKKVFSLLLVPWLARRPGSFEQHGEGLVLFYFKASPIPHQQYPILVRIQVQPMFFTQTLRQLKHLILCRMLAVYSMDKRKEGTEWTTKQLFL